MSELRPRIYISSTIYDFKDLRSALKYWLEELGYEVMLSEYNDFNKPLDENSYEACLRAVERANYFILLIGARVGGAFSVAQKVSITRMEYRTAYNLVTTGKMKLVTFVRQDLWDVKEDRRALKEFLINDYKLQREIDDSDISPVIAHPSKFVNDAEAVFDFLNEVGRVHEMKQAMLGNGDFPVANWIHQFSTFKDIIDTLSIVFGANQNLSTIALTTNLKRELLSNLTKLTAKNKNGQILFNTRYGDFARINFKGGLDDFSSIPRKYVRWLVLYLLFKTRGNRLTTQFLDQALTSGEFLEYDFVSNSYKVGLIHDALLKLQENITRLKGFDDELADEQARAFILKYNPKDNPSINMDGNIALSNQELLIPFVCYDCEKNIAELCIGLLKAFDGDYSKLQNLKLRPATPSESEAEEIEKETTTLEDITDWIKGQ